MKLKFTESITGTLNFELVSSEPAGWQVSKKTVPDWYGDMDPGDLCSRLDVCAYGDDDGRKGKILSKWRENIILTSGNALADDYFDVFVTFADEDFFDGSDFSKTEIGKKLAASSVEYAGKNVTVIVRPSTANEYINEEDYRKLMLQMLPEEYKNLVILDCDDIYHAHY